jgi:hypothetical protein
MAHQEAPWCSESNRVVAGNTQAITTLNKSSDDTKGLMIEIKDQLLSRPCLLPEELKDKIARIIRQQ